MRQQQNRIIAVGVHVGLQRPMNNIRYADSSRLHTQYSWCSVPGAVWLMFVWFCCVGRFVVSVCRGGLSRFLPYWERLTKPSPGWERQRPVKSEAAAFKALREQQKKGACPTWRKPSLERTTWKCSSSCSWTSLTIQGHQRVRNFSFSVATLWKLCLSHVSGRCLVIKKDAASVGSSKSQLFIHPSPVEPPTPPTHSPGPMVIPNR